ncbi:YraN family protein [Spelaeicoccus albus]|uniref:UPF0102 protein BJY26_002055 n=1 Tax=Spelaeicoccus albus TaxID=1280376 RepID=A0A7Z0D2M7_9MICO|nr:YraN family protein [Spelaeicoccus albus]NYI67749.1 putative endonuclease [Spelaeicoccus albus]
MRRKDELGQWGEKCAADHLAAQGFDLLDRNWHCRDGEIDLVARDGDCLVIVEVKTRRTGSAGHPLEAVTAKKLATLRRLAALWLRGHPVAAATIRIDVVGVLCAGEGRAAIEHVRNVSL